MAALSLIAVSAILVGYAEIRSASLVRYHQNKSVAVHADLLETMLDLQSERLGVLARQLAAYPMVDAAIADGELAPGFEDLLELDGIAVPEESALQLVDADGAVLARAFDQRISVSADVSALAIDPTADTLLALTGDGVPILAHHAPIRRVDNVVGGILLLMPIGGVTSTFFPDLEGLAFRAPGQPVTRLFGEEIASDAVLPGHSLQARSTVLPGTNNERMEAIFLPIELSGGSSTGDLILLEEITTTLLQGELLSRLTFTAVVVIILVSLGVLLRSLRLGFRPLGAVVLLLESMSRGETSLRFSQETTKASRGSADTEADAERSSASSGQEIDTLLRAVESFRASLDARNALIAVREQLENARRIQQSLLPNNFDLHPGLDVHGLMHPAEEVAGDFFDLFRFDDGRVAVLIADVSGKGLAPALFASQASALIRSLCHQATSLPEAMRLANLSLCERNPEGLFLTAILAAVTPETGHIAFVNAGHCRPLLSKSNGTIEQVVTDPEPIVGVLPDLEWTQHQLTLSGGDRLLLYSDGFDEAQAADGSFLGTDRVLEISSQASEDVSSTSEQVTNSMLEGIESFVGSAPQADDITLIALRAAWHDRQPLPAGR